MRRAGIAGVGSLVVAILLLGCGSGRETSPTAPAPSAGGLGRLIEEEASIPVAGGVHLAGTLAHWGAEGEPRPAVLWLAGSGRTDRDGNNPLISGRPDSYRIVGATLAEAGFVVLRYDKRGSGRSPDWEVVTSIDQLTVDVVSAWQFLASRPEVDPARMALIGHSEGGLLALLVARELRPAALGLVAAPSVREIDLLRQQLVAQIPTRPEWVEAGCLELGNRLIDALEAGGELPPLPDGLPEPWDTVFRAMTDPARVSLFRAVGFIDPAAQAAGLQEPVLLLYGDRDDQVGAAEGERLAAALRDSGNQNVTLEVIPRMDHMLKIVRGEEPEEYGAPGREVAPDLLRRLVAWLDVTLRP